MSLITRLISVFVLTSFFINSVIPAVYASGGMSLLPTDGVLVTSSVFSPAILKGMLIHPDDALKFEFYFDTGTDNISGETLHTETENSVKYFLSALTTPDEDLWVNLSPIEKDRIVPVGFGETLMGRDILAEDYVLKQLASSLLHPDSTTGKEFWARIYAETEQKIDLTQSMEEFSRVWIVPSEASVWEHNGKVVISNSRLKVLLEKDYLSQRASVASGSETAGPSQDKVDQILRDVLVPVLEKEVNEGMHFSRLRQIYAALILSSWYKIRLKEGLLAQTYLDKNKVMGVEFSDEIGKDIIYNKYLSSVKNGVFNFIREEPSAVSETFVPRKYFSGGFSGTSLKSLVIASLTAAALTLSLPSDVQAVGEVVQASVQIDVIPGNTSVNSRKSVGYAVSRFGALGAEIDNLLDLGEPSLRYLRKRLASERDRVVIQDLVAKRGDKYLMPVLFEALGLDYVDTQDPVDVLVHALSYVNPSARVIVVKALGNLGNIKVVPALMDLLNKDAEVLVKRQAAIALGSLKDARAVSVLIGTLNNRDLYTVSSESIILINDLKQMALYIKLLSSADKHLRSVGAYILSKMLRPTNVYEIKMIVTAMPDMVDAHEAEVLLKHLGDYNYLLWSRGKWAFLLFFGVPFIVPKGFKFIKARLINSDSAKQDQAQRSVENKPKELGGVDLDARKLNLAINVNAASNIFSLAQQGELDANMLGLTPNVYHIESVGLAVLSAVAASSQ